LVRLQNAASLSVRIAFCPLLSLHLLIVLSPPDIGNSFPCNSATVVTDTLITCTSSPGAGSNLVVNVTVRAWLQTYHFLDDDV